MLELLFIMATGAVVYKKMYSEISTHDPLEHDPIHGNTGKQRNLMNKNLINYKLSPPHKETSRVANPNSTLFRAGSEWRKKYDNILQTHWKEYTHPLLDPLVVGERKMILQEPVQNKKF